MALIVTALMWTALLALVGLFALLVLVVITEEKEMFSDEKDKDETKTERPGQDSDMDGGSN
jgi:hypothetical protein